MLWVRMRGGFNSNIFKRVTSKYNSLLSNCASHFSHKIVLFIFSALTQEVQAVAK